MTSRLIEALSDFIDMHRDHNVLEVDHDRISHLEGVTDINYNTLLSSLLLNFENNPGPKFHRMYNESIVQTPMYIDTEQTWMEYIEEYTAVREEWIPEEFFMYEDLFLGLIRALCIFTIQVGPMEAYQKIQALLQKIPDQMTQDEQASYLYRMIAEITSELPQDVVSELYRYQDI